MKFLKSMMMGLGVALATLFLVGCIADRPSEEDPEHQPCLNVLCGQACSPCAADDPDCVAPGVVTVCNGAGECVHEGSGALECDADQCTPGTTFESADGCNSCQCPPSGLRSEATCSTRDCRPDACEPGATFDAPDGCNVCQCPESGLRADAVCTNRDCSDRCEPGTQFPLGDDCNVCDCPASGRRDEAMCTQRVCRPPCDGQPCGADCTPSSPQNALPGGQDEPDGDGARVAPRRSQCNILGQCVPSDVEPLHCEDRCHQVACGERCRPVGEVDGDRAPAAPGSGGAPGVEICNGEGECVWAGGVGQTECPSPCDGLSCGDFCEPDPSSSGATSQAGEEPEGDEEPSGSAGAPVSQPEPPETRCNQAGMCVSNRDVSELMCE